VFKDSQRLLKSVNKFQEFIVLIEEALSKTLRKAQETNVSSRDLDKIVSCFQTLKTQLDYADRHYFSLHNVDAIQEEQLQSLRYELRTQLGALQGYCDLFIEDDLPSPLYDEVETLLMLTHPVFDRIEDLKIHTLGGAEDKQRQLEASFTPLFHSRSAVVIAQCENIREILTRRLGKIHLHVHEAKDIPSGDALIHKIKPDIVILDIYCSQDKGYAFIQKIHQDPQLRLIPILVLSSLHEVKNIIRSIEAGAEDYLPLPLNPTLLNYRIKSALEKKILREKEYDYLDKIKLSQQRLQTTLNRFEHAAVLFDKNHHIVLFNQKFIDLYPRIHDFGGAISLTDFLHAHFKKTFPEGTTSSCPSQEDQAYLNFETAFVRDRINGDKVKIRNYKIPDGGFISVHQEKI